MSPSVTPRPAEACGLGLLVWAVVMAGGASLGFGVAWLAQRRWSR